MKFGVAHAPIIYMSVDNGLPAKSWPATATVWFYLCIYDIMTIFFVKNRHRMFSTAAADRVFYRFVQKVDVDVATNYV